MCTCVCMQYDLPPLPTVKRSSPLTTQMWSEHMSPEGQVKDVDKLKDIIFRGVSCYCTHSNHYRLDFTAIRVTLCLHHVENGCNLCVQGIDSEVRVEVWKFLLGYYSWDSTHKSRADFRKKRV